MDEKMLQDNKEQEKIDFGRIFLTSIKAFAVFAILLGLVYPLAITGIAQVSMSYKANGSLIQKDGKILGSERIAQNFEGQEYFHPRPSAVNYDGANSGASNLSPSSAEFQGIVKERIDKIRRIENIDTNVNIPPDMVTSSASGLDPNISMENANIQLKRVAKKRYLSENVVEEIVKQNMDSNFQGIWGQTSVNVLKLNLALDLMSGEKK